MLLYCPYEISTGHKARREPQAADIPQKISISQRLAIFVMIFHLTPLHYSVAPSRPEQEQKQVFQASTLLYLQIFHYHQETASTHVLDDSHISSLFITYSVYAYISTRCNGQGRTVQTVTQRLFYVSPTVIPRRLIPAGLFQNSKLIATVP